MPRDTDSCSNRSNERKSQTRRSKILDRAELERAPPLVGQASLGNRFRGFELLGKERDAPFFQEPAVALELRVLAARQREASRALFVLANERREKRRALTILLWILAHAQDA